MNFKDKNLLEDFKEFHPVTYVPEKVLNGLNEGAFINPMICERLPLEDEAHEILTAYMDQVGAKMLTHGEFYYLVAPTIHHYEREEDVSYELLTIKIYDFLNYCL